MSLNRDDSMQRLIDDAASELRGAGQQPAGYNEYGSVVTPGYKVESFNGDDIVRIEHKLPAPDLTDPDRMGTDEMYLARLAARDAYAATLRAAGWTVEERTVHVNRPILLAVFEADGQRENPAQTAPTCENR